MTKINFYPGEINEIKMKHIEFFPDKSITSSLFELEGNKKVMFEVGLELFICPKPEAVRRVQAQAKRINLGEAEVSSMLSLMASYVVDKNPFLANVSDMLKEKDGNFDALSGIKNSFAGSVLMSRINGISPGENKEPVPVQLEFKFSEDSPAKVRPNNFAFKTSE